MCRVHLFPKFSLGRVFALHFSSFSLFLLSTTLRFEYALFRSAYIHTRYEREKNEGVNVRNLGHVNMKEEKEASLVFVLSSSSSLSLRMCQMQKRKQIRRDMVISRSGEHCTRRDMCVYILLRGFRIVKKNNNLRGD